MKVLLDETDVRFLLLERLTGVRRVFEGSLAAGRTLIELRVSGNEVKSNEIAGEILLDKLSRDTTEVREMLEGALAEGRSLMELRAQGGVAAVQHMAARQ